MEEGEPQRQSDFWWLTASEADNYKYVCVGYQEPYSDEPNSSREPLAVSWFHSLDTGGNPSDMERRYPLEFVDRWRERWANTNVFRSLSLFNAEHHGEELLGPFLIDIDREEYQHDKGYVQDISEALEATRQIVKDYLGKLCKLAEHDFRIFFSGHKGLHIEVRPLAIGITCTRNRKQEFERRLGDANKFLGGSSKGRFVDKFHEYVRLHDSLNSWVGNHGKKIARMKLELSLRELNSMGEDEICARAERFASNSL